MLLLAENKVITVVLDKIEELRKCKINYNRFSKFKHIDKDKGLFLTFLSFCLDFHFSFGIAIFFPPDFDYGYFLVFLLFCILWFVFGFNKHIKRLRHLNRLQDKYYHRYELILNRLDINKNYEAYYQNVIMLNEAGRINEIPIEVVKEIILVYKKNKEEKYSIEEMIENHLKIHNQHYIEIAND